MYSKLFFILLGFFLILTACGSEDTKQEERVNSLDNQSLPSTKTKEISEEPYVEKEYVEPETQSNLRSLQEDTLKKEMKMNLKLPDSSKLKNSSEIQGLEKEY